MPRKCSKCKEELVVNKELGYMECVSGLHIEPINLILPQWWNQCPECGIMGTNTIEYEHIDYRENPPKKIENQKTYTCKNCGHGFIKKGALS